MSEDDLTTKYEASLRRAFVDRKAESIVISSRRDEYQINAANYGMDMGWIVGEWDETDIQSTIWIGRLTDKGRKHFGL